jgi:SAM-dependent MidA family methyltransferase
MPIDSRIRSLINQKGYIPLDVMMEEVMTVSPSSYYRKSGAIGINGDFITAPEISQMFGEMIALWIIEQWHKLGKPTDFYLLELGPGNGTLIRDILRTIKLVPECFVAVNILLYDVNTAFEDQQYSAVSEHNKTPEFLREKADLLAICDQLSAPFIVVANEFFDALPIKQYYKNKKEWYELILIADPNDGKIKFDKIKILNLLQHYLLATHKNATDGAVIEDSPQSVDVFKTICNILVQKRGAVLVIDYGYYLPIHERAAHQYTSTLQAIKNHAYHPVLDTLGDADLTAHVDFYNLQEVASINELKISSLYSQRDFLLKYGILNRLELLKQRNISESAILDNQVNRLIGEDYMGKLFKVLEIFRS